jgi:hypothetical protein
MNRNFQVLVLLCAVLFIGAGVASADTLQFVLAGPTTATFDLPSSPTIMTGNSDVGFGFTITPINLVVNGMAAPTDFLGFFNADPAAGGGVAIFASSSNMVAYAFGPQIYSGPETNPTFAPGVFSLADALADTPVLGQYALTITDLTTVSTPEPSVTILLAIGLVAVGLAVLRFKPNFGIRAS